jgi:hypothetical protein
LIKQHHEYLQSLESKEHVITEGIFSGSGGILILKGDSDSVGLLDADPAIKEGIVSVNTKKLWIAKGSFCEQ